MSEKLGRLSGIGGRLELSVGKRAYVGRFVVSISPCRGLGVGIVGCGRISKSRRPTSFRNSNNHV